MGDEFVKLAHEPKLALQWEQEGQEQSVRAEIYQMEVVACERRWGESEY